VSQQIRTLEERYGRRLLERTRGNVQLTPAGEILYQACKEIVQRYQELDARLQAMANVVAGTVRVATVHSVGLYELPGQIKRYLKAYPQVNLHVEYSRPNRIYEDCLLGAVDVGVVAYPRAHKGLDVIPLASDRLVLICPPEHAFARRRRIDIRALDGQSFIAFERDIPSRQALDRIFRQNKVKVRIAMEFDNIETIKRSVEIGAGVSIVPLLSVEREIETGALAQVHFSRQNYLRPLGLIMRRNHALSAPAERLVELLVEPRDAPAARR